MSLSALLASLRRRWDHLPLRWKGLSVVAVPIVPLSVLSALVVLSIGSQERAERSVSHTLAVDQSVNALEVLALEAETSVRGFMLTGDRTWLAQYTSAAERLRTSLTDLAALVPSDAGQSARARRVAQLAVARFGLFEELLSYAGSSSPPTPLLQQGHESMKALRAELHAMRDDERRLLTQRRDRLDELRRTTRVMVAVAGLSGIAAGIVAAWLLIRNITARLRRANDDAQRLANGERPLRTSPPSGDEVAQLEQGLHRAALLLEARVSELRIAREELDRFFGLSLDMLCIASVDGQFQRLNPAWEQTLGWTTGDLTATRYFEFVHPDDQQVTAERAADLSRGGTVVNFTNRYRCKDGTYRWLSWKAAAQPELNRVYAAARDVTEDRTHAQALERHAAELAEARLAAEGANRAKTDFLAHMSHDLRTPLNAILGFSQLLERDALSPDQRESVRHIQQAGAHLLHIIAEVIDITRIESGQMSLSPEAIMLGETVTQASQLIAPLVAARGLALSEESVAPEAAVLADPQRLQQVLLNLLSNAVKYNRPHGHIHVRVAPGAPGRWRITVADTGAGISPEKIDLLFRPFERLGAEQAGIEGTGLGLALSRAMVEAMGGTVGVESVPDSGSTFWVELPAAALHAETTIKEVPHVSDGEAPADAGIVLYIEDNATNVRLMERILGLRPGVTLLTASTARAGLTLAQAHHPDLLFVDLHLGDGTTGEEVLWELWQHPSTRRLPAIVLTADVTPGLSRRLHAAGAREHLTKPLNVARVLAMVDRYLGEARRNSGDGIAV